VTVTQGVSAVGVAGWPVIVTGWAGRMVTVTVGVVIQPEADAERYRCACLHCTQGLAGRGDGYQCGLDWARSSTVLRAVQRYVDICCSLDRHRILTSV